MHVPDAEGREPSAQTRFGWAADVTVQTEPSELRDPPSGQPQPFPSVQYEKYVRVHVLPESVEPKGHVSEPRGAAVGETWREHTGGEASRERTSDDVSQTHVAQGEELGRTKARAVGVREGVAVDPVSIEPPEPPPPMEIARGVGVREGVPVEEHAREIAG